MSNISCTGWLSWISFAPKIFFLIIEILFLLNITQVFYDDFPQVEVSFMIVILDA